MAFKFTKQLTDNQAFGEGFFDPLAGIAAGLPGGYQPRRTRTSVDVDELIELLKQYGQDARMEVTGEHAAILKAVFTDHRNVFLTGGAGTGKTSFVKHILIPELNNRGIHFDVTASTGIAGSHLSGRTLHSWAGVGLGPQWPPGVPVLNMSLAAIEAYYETTYQAWMDNPRVTRPMREGVLKRLKGCEFLIVDEVSMTTGYAFLGYLDFMFKKVRDNDKPFGGIQMFFVGDFSQLPPVEKWIGPRVDWAFLCKAWSDAKVKSMPLTRIFRQKDGWFTDLLNSVREGKPLTQAQRQQLKPYVRKPTRDDELKLSFLAPTNKEADDVNWSVLQQYPGQQHDLDVIFDIRPEQLKHYEDEDKVRKQLMDGKLLRARLSLKLNLPVMITVNAPYDGDTGTQAYVNGTKGFVHEFIYDKKDAKLVSTIRVRVPPKRDAQPIPLFNADGTPLRNAQGQHLHEAPKDEFHSFARRRYSRSANEDADEIIPVDPNEWAEAIKAGTEMPKVKHAYPGVSQFPLIPASSITVHKSQGMSLDECVISLNKAFAAGQVYVALSRLTSPAGLVLTSDEMPIFADPHAMAFNQSLVPESLDIGPPLPPPAPKIVETNIAFAEAAPVPQAPSAPLACEEADWTPGAPKTVPFEESSPEAFFRGEPIPMPSPEAIKAHLDSQGYIPETVVKVEVPARLDDAAPWDVGSASDDEIPMTW